MRRIFKSRKDRTPEGSGAPSSASSDAPQTPSLSTQPNPASQQAPSFPDGIHVWHDCPDATIDVCFIHGLTGNRDTTWTAEAQSTPWPTTLLPSALPGARLLTWGYDAYVVRKSAASKNRLIDHAMNLLGDLTNARVSNKEPSRRIVFIAHSLGGLVCKEALLLSRNHSELHLRGIFDYTIGVLFMGTPHRGSWIAHWAKIPASALGVVKSTNKSLLAILDTHDEMLESVQIQFWSMVRDLQRSDRTFEVTCFFEELGLPGVGQVVLKESATQEGYAAYSIHANHSDMVKFRSAEDNGFIRAQGTLKRWQGLPLTTVPARSIYPTSDQIVASPRPSAVLPFGRDSDFVERVEVLGEMDKKCVKPGSRIALVGLGGIGKSQLAIEYAYRTRDQSADTWVFWVHTSNAARFELSFREIANYVQVPGRQDKDANIFQLVHDWLRDERRKWVLILDNVDDADFLFDRRGNPVRQSIGANSNRGQPLASYLPRCPNGSILFTTRNKNEARKLVENRDIIVIEPMTTGEAKSLFRKKLEGYHDDDDDEKLGDLAAALEYMPLAIIQAAAYISQRAPFCSVQQYLTLFRKNDRKKKVFSTGKAANYVAIQRQITLSLLHGRSHSSTFDKSRNPPQTYYQL